VVLGRLRLTRRHFIGATVISGVTLAACADDDDDDGDGDATPGIEASVAINTPAGTAGASATQVLAPTPSLDGKYTVFGRVVSGMDVIEKIEAVPLNGEDPVTRIDVTRVTVARSP